MKHQWLFFTLALLAAIIFVAEPVSLSGQDAFMVERHAKFRGEITDVEYYSRIKEKLQLMQANEYEPAPGEPAVKCLFPVINEVRYRDPGFGKIETSFTVQRPVKQASYITPEGHFKIHYDTTGVDSIPLTYFEGLDIPDWIHEAVLALEQSWFILIDSLGYEVPPVDSIDGNQVDVYFREMGVFYGQTNTDNGLIEGQKNTSYIEIDQNFRESIYYSPGLDGLRVTAAHEFFHVVQLGYNFRSMDVWFFELSSTWFEDVAYDYINDYVQYLPDYFSYPSNPLPNTGGYEVAVWGLFLESRYGIGIFKDIWENMIDSPAGEATDISLIDAGGSGGVKSAFGEFAVWNWFTGDKAEPELYYEEGELYPEVATTGDSTLITSIRDTAWLDELAVSYYAVRPSELTSVTAIFDAVQPDLWSSTLIIDAPLRTTRIEPLYVAEDVLLDSVGTLTDLVLVIANGEFDPDRIINGEYYISIESAGGVIEIKSRTLSNFPNPFNPGISSHTNLRFELAESSEITFIIYNILGQTVYRTELGELDEGKWNIRWDGTGDAGIPAASGVYIYRVKGEGVDLKGKFTLLR